MNGTNARDPATAFREALVLHGQGRLEDAERLYGAVLASAPEHAGAHLYLGVLEAQRGRFAEAEAAMARSIAADPANPLAHYNRGNALRDLKRNADALTSFERACALKPDFAQAWSNRAAILHDLKRLEEALACYDRAIASNPGHAETYSDRGLVLHELCRFGEALANFDRAIALKRDYALAYFNRGVTFKSLGQLDKALGDFDAAIARNPGHAGSHYNRGSTLQDMGRIEEALAEYERAHALDPDIAFLEGWRVHAKMHLCAWDGLAEDIAQLERHIEEGKPAASPFVLVASSGSTALQAACARIFAAKNYPASDTPLWRGEAYRHEKIRIGYMCGEFREHVTAHFTAGLFEHHDRAAFEIHAIATGADDGSAIRRRIAAAFDSFTDVSAKTDRAIAGLVRSREIDILVDLNGYIGANRTGVPALRPCPVQVNYFGYPGTMGAPYIDYILADRIVIPEESRRHYSENVVYLPDTYQSNDRNQTVGSRVFGREECSLPERSFVFACFNGNFKLLPEIFDVWMRLLARVPESVLWLLEGDPCAARNLRREALARGIAAERIVFAPKMPLADHLSRSRHADLFLDTIPCNAHTTASDALWCGVPVLTAPGETFAGRVAASLLNAIGLPELITGSLADYEALALSLAQEPARLAAIKAKLVRNRETMPLFDAPRITRHIEAAYRTMHERQAQGLPPAPFAVEAME